MINNLPPLWDHQVAAKEFARDKPAIMLEMAMRTGKSRVTIEILEEREARRVLIFCPAHVVDVWPDQFEEYALSTSVALPLREGSLASRVQKANELLGWGKLPQYADYMKAIVINYEACDRRVFQDWVMQQSWDAIVLDESHHLKAPGGSRSRFVSRLAMNIPTRIALTGTPMPHSPLDIYAQYRILDRSIFGTAIARLRERYIIYAQGKIGVQIEIGCRINPKDTRYFSPDLYAEFREKMFRIAFQVKADVLNLKEPLHIPRYCQLGSEGRRAYREMERDFYAEVDEGVITAANAMVKVTRLQQMTSGHGKLAGTDEIVEVDTAKRKLMQDIMGDLDEPVVVFCRFRADLDAVHTVATALGWEHFELSGRIDEKSLWVISDNPLSVLAVQVQAGGEGIDLSRAKIAIYYSFGSRGNHEQSLARMQAKDQAYSLAYYYLLVENSIDGKMAKALQDGTDMIEAILRR